MITLPVKPTDRVLEIGSGHNPHPRSDVLCDRFLSDNQERQRAALRFDRPLVIAQGEQLPFSDKSFDFVYCSQILEHSEDPIAFAAEVSRVGKAGLFIFPHMIRERLFGWEYHRWFFHRRKEVVYYVEKKGKDQLPLAHFIHRLYAHDARFRQFINQHEEKFNIYLWWHKTVPLKPSYRPKEKIMETADEQLAELLESMAFESMSPSSFDFKQIPKKGYLKIKKYIRLKQWQKQMNQNPKSNLNQVLPSCQCLMCKGVLTGNAQAIRCTQCDTKYPMVQGVPILLTKQALKLGY